MLSEVYGDRMASSAGGEGESFPLQQKLLVCCLLLLTKSGKHKEVVLGKVDTCVCVYIYYLILYLVSPSGSGSIPTVSLL